MELICPSCEARYQLPDGAIGEKGRQVSCMSCGNGWHAYPPLVLGAMERSAPSTASVGIPFGAASGGRPTAAQMAPATGHQPSVEDEVATSSGIPDKPSASRTEQLAEIREMLAEVQSEDQDASSTPERADALAGLSAVSDPQGLRAAALADAKAAEADVADTPTLGRDPADDLEARFDRKSEKTSKPKEVDVKSIRKRHDRRERTRKRAKAPGTGAFLTGFLLVVIVVAVLIGLYVLHPAIINKMPGTEQALTEYVATVDSFRVTIAETFDRAKNMVTGG
ncbi:MAG: zinc-ribbon domain-containing protein [Paracoccaceae bacterium]